MARYAYLWEFRVAEAQRPAFERQYGPEGAWVRLFRQAPGFIGTILLKDRSDPSRYVTVDRWETVDAHREFLARYAREYRELDEQCAGLTISETRIGEFCE